MLAKLLREKREEKREQATVTKVVDMLARNEVEMSVLRSFEQYLRSMFTYKVQLKKYQYHLWDIDKLQGKIANHILVFGYNEGVIHFIKSTRQKCEIPIVFFTREDISTNVFKLNNIFGNIFHFMGDPYDKSQLDKACIQEAFAVIVLSVEDADTTVLEDDAAIKIVRMIEQFYKIERLLVEVLDVTKLMMLGYEPKHTACDYYYWPFFMNGKVLMSGLFDSLIMWTQDHSNHLDTLKKLVSGSLFKSPSSSTQEENHHLMQLPVPEYYTARTKSYGELFERFLEFKCVCLGIFRRVSDVDDDNMLKEEFSFENMWAEFFQGDEEKFTTNLSDFKCNMNLLHTKQLMINPHEDMVLKPNDHVLLIGSIPLKECENYLLMNRMKKHNLTDRTIRQERAKLTIEALQAKINRRERNLRELEKELHKRTNKYADFSEHHPVLVKREETDSQMKDFRMIIGEDDAEPLVVEEEDSNDLLGENR